MNAPILHCMQKLAYASTAGVNPPDGLGGPTSNGALAPHTIAGAFFVPAVCVMAAVRGTPKGVPVPFDRSANLRTVVSITCLAASGDDSHNSNGVIPMHTLSVRLHTLNPSVIHRAKAHRAMALAALRSNSSLHNRLKRYNAHIAIARQLEGKGGAA